MNKLFSYIINLKNSKYQKKIILFGTSFFALHTLYFIYSLAVNVPVVDGWDLVPFAEMIVNGEPFWEFNTFWINAAHGLIFPNLVVVASVLFSSWNFIYLMYFSWILISISVLVTYFILKNTFPNAIWLIVPIAAILYSPVQYGILLWGTAGVSWFMDATFMFLSIYFLNKINTNRYFILPAITCGIVATFSTAPGIVIWLVGFYSIFFQTKWKKSSLIIWSICLIIILGIFIFIFSLDSTIKKSADLEKIFSMYGVTNFLFYLSHGIVLKIDMFRAIAGAFILISIISPFLYYIYKKKMESKFIPWTQLGLIGIWISGITLIGRPGTFPSRYSTMAAFDQIAALVIATIIAYFIYSKLSSVKKKRILVIIYVIIFSIFIFSLSTAYYFGWREGDQWKSTNVEFLECLLNPIFEFKCVSPSNFNLHNMVYRNAPILQDLNLGPFYNERTMPKEIPLLDEKHWDIMKMTLESEGSIENIRFDVSNELDHNLQKYEIIDKSDLLQIYGWVVFKNQNHSVESAYIIIDDEVHSKAVYGFIRKDLQKYGLEERSFSGWQGIIDPKEIPLGCHDVSIRIVSGNEYSELKLEKELCKKSINSK
jgi:hypothetical protein